MILAGIVFASFMMKLAHWLVPKLEMAILNRQAEAMAALVLPRPHCPIFIASVGYDEAGLLLNFWDRLTFVPQAIVDLAREVVGGAVIGVGSAFVLSLFGAAIEGFAEGFGYDIKWFDGLPVAAATFLLLLFYAATAVMIFGLCAVLAASLFRGSRIAFGGEDPLFIAGIRVVAMTSPDWTPLPGSQYRSYEVSGSLRQLRHSMFYESRDVLHDMARWIVRPPTEAAPSWPRPTSASEKSGIVTSMSTWIAFLATIAFALFGYLNPEAFAAINAFLVPD
ncbi:hypothetical protein OKA06_03195 [Novosphingobium sp. MW5]|nr:hypothetical protein [Novosphingobium sp. MW5]